MDKVYQDLTQRVIKHYNTVHNDNTGIPKRLFIAVAGPPGSGKSTLSAQIVQRLNDHYHAPLCMTVPMDGYHYPRKYLDTLPNKEEAYARRGAFWTFDATALFDLVKAIRGQVSGEIVRANSFDHALGDPVVEDIEILFSHRILIFEGNYLHLNAPVWKEVYSLMDETWFIDVDERIARDRVAKRHVKAGICPDLLAAYARVDGNDIPNGRFIRENSLPPTVKVQSIEES